MNGVKTALLAAIVIGATLALLRVTGVLSPDQTRAAGMAAFGGLAVIVLAGVALRLLRRPSGAVDATDRPVP